MGDLIVTGRTWGGSLRLEDTPTTPAIEVRMSADGRGFVTDVWHEGPEAEAVYVEVHRARGRSFHGWIDGHTRQIVQAG
jgi:hypothetical protein